MLFTGYGAVQLFVDIPMACVNVAVADHFVMLFRDMPNEPFYEIHNRDRFFHIYIILMPVIMEGNKVAVIFINPGGRNDRPAKIAADVFNNSFGITFVWLCVNIEAVFVFPVATGFNLFERRTNTGFHVVQQSGTESITEEGIVKMRDVAPETVITVTTFGNEAVDVRVPF